MILKSNFIKTFLALVVLLLVCACGQNKSDKKMAQPNKKTTDEHVLIIDTFSTFPPEIDGCSCYFSNNSTEFKKDTYIYMNDYAETSFLKVNGVLTKFTQTEFKVINETKTIAKAKSEKYEMTIEVVDGMQSGDETYLKSGTITLKDKKRKTIKKTFYGECGC